MNHEKGTPYLVLKGKQIPDRLKKYVGSIVYKVYDLSISQEDSLVKHGYALFSCKCSDGTTQHFIYNVVQEAAVNELLLAARNVD